MAILAVVISAANAPWIHIHPGIEPGIFADPRQASIIYAPLWSPPTFGNHIVDAGPLGDECRLNTTLLLLFWAFIAIVYAGLFFMLKGTDFISKLINLIGK